MIVVEVPGKPQGKGRLRYRVVRSRANPAGYPSGYTPRATVDYERMVRDAGRLAMAGRQPLMCGPRGLLCNIFAYFPVPKSWPRRKREAALRDEIRPTGKPDRDNIEKVIDALRGVVIGDDAFITDGRTAKLYDACPRLVFEIEALI